MIHEGKTIVGIIPLDDEPGADASKKCEMTIMRTDHSWRRHRVLPLH